MLSIRCITPARVQSTAVPVHHYILNTRPANNKFKTCNTHSSLISTHYNKFMSTQSNNTSNSSHPTPTSHTDNQSLQSTNTLDINTHNTHTNHNADTDTTKTSSTPESRSYDETINSSAVSAGPITWRSVLVLLISGGIGVALYQYEKDRKLHSASNQRQVGTPLVGGSYELMDMHGRSVDSTIDYKGKYQLIYFGFTHCPDICPAELEKMQLAVKQFNEKNKSSKHHPVLVPLFISIDPKRDTVDRLQKYSREWSPDIQWLTGTDQQIKSVAKKFRVYYSSPEWSEGSDDAYLVDHSIFFYLMDRQGEFMQFFGKNMSAEDIALKMDQLIREDSNV